jgi:hypothetical protein
VVGNALGAFLKQASEQHFCVECLAVELRLDVRGALQGDAAGMDRDRGHCVDDRL